MTTRYVISSDQLHAIKVQLDKLQSAYTDDPLESCKRMIKRIRDHQCIGDSKNMFFDDIRDLRNLFASWCGTTKD